MSIILEEMVAWHDAAKATKAEKINIPISAFAIIISHIRTEESKLATLQKHLELTKGKSS